MPRIYSLRRDGRTTPRLRSAVGLAPEFTNALNPPERRARTFQQHAEALAAQAVLRWQATRRRILTLDEVAEDDRLGSALITFDRFA